MEGIEYEFIEAKVLSNDDLLVSGQIKNEHEECQDAVLALFDLNKGLKLKKKFNYIFINHLTEMT